MRGCFVHTLVSMAFLLFGSGQGAAADRFHSSPVLPPVPRAQTGTEIHLVLSTSRAPYESQVVDGLIDEFFGPGQSHNGSIDFENADPTGVLNLGRGQHVGVRFRRPLGPETSGIARYFGTLSLGVDRQNYVAPDGIGPFKEKMTLSVWGLMMSADVERRWRWPLGAKGQRHLSAGVALGASLAHYKAALTSPLLDLRTQGWSQDAYLRGSVAWPVLRTRGAGIMLESDLIAYSSGGMDVTFGLALAF